MRKAMENVAAMFLVPAREKELDLEFRVEDEVPGILVGDEARIQQILINLVGNAVKFTNRGSISVRVSNQGGLGQGRNRIILEVKDTGVGIPDNLLANVFLPFVQGGVALSDKVPGTGLGLSIVKRLVDLMGGTLKLYSEEGNGTRVVAALPLAAPEESPLEPAEEKPDESSPAADPLNRDIVILVVEDNRINQMMTRELLQEYGYQVSVAESGAKALEILNTEPADIILMDVQMPKMSGEEATAHIRAGETAAPPDIPIIALTAYAMEGDAEKFMDAGMNDYVSKPCDFDILNTKIHKLIKRTFARPLH